MVRSMLILMNFKSVRTFFCLQYCVTSSLTPNHVESKRGPFSTMLQDNAVRDSPTEGVSRAITGSPAVGSVSKPAVV